MQKNRNKFRQAIDVTGSIRVNNFFTRDDNPNRRLRVENSRVRDLLLEFIAFELFLAYLTLLDSNKVINNYH